ncbi:hypothetical protein SO802_020289 [Lithocarpus litseifolius]|uniref:Uncharacterized protein n=1 Tax=Lithocarpus litseifolius TaxID=425828 RepID=A0AAW2CC37_9ROSI
MGRFKSPVDSEEAIESFRALYRIPPGMSMRYCKEDRHATKLNFSLVNKDSLEKILEAEVFISKDGQLRAVHLILGNKPISSSFQVPKCVIKVKDRRLHQISIAIPGFLLPKGTPILEGTLVTQPILEGVPKVPFPPPHTTSEATSSQPTDKEEGEVEEEKEKEVVDVSDSDDFYEPSLASCKPRSTLQELLESQLGGNAPGNGVLTRLPTPPPALPFQLEPSDLKRKREPKGKEVVEVGKTHPSQTDEAQRVAKQAKVGQKDAEKRSDPQVEPAAWLPAPMLDGAPMPANASIRDFQGGKAGYIADVVEQALLLLEDMAELRSMKRHGVFLNVKRYLAMVEQDGYDLGVAETEEALRAQVSGVCRTYCSQVWSKALNQVGVEASSILRRAESVFYLPAIRESAPSSSRIGSTSEGVAPDAIKPPAIIQYPPTEKEAHTKMEIVLTTFPLPAKADPASKGSEASEVAST